MVKLDQFQTIVTDFAHAVDFVTVYIAEAHPTDGWALGGNKYIIKQHQLLVDRVKSAKMLNDRGSKCPIVVDTMSNEARDKYGSLPEALYIIKDGIVIFKAVGPNCYQPDDVRKKLDIELGKNK